MATAVGDGAIDPSKANEAANQSIDDIVQEVLDFEDVSGRTSLYAALEQGQLECASILLEEHDVDATVKNVASEMLPLHVFLSQDGVLSNQKVLHRLLRKRHADAPEETIEKDIVNSQSIEKVTPLMIAAASMHLGSTRHVLSSFAFENDACLARPAAGEDMLSAGPKSRRKHKEQKAVQGAIPPDAAADENGEVGEKGGGGVLATAAGDLVGQTGRKQALDFVVEILVAKKADASLQDIHGCTALDYAARAGVLSHVEFLCQQNIVTRVQTERALFTTTASSGAHAGNVNVLKYLMLYAGSSPRDPSALRATGMGPEFSGENALFGMPHPILGETILHVAARFGRSR